MVRNVSIRITEIEARTEDFNSKAEAALASEGLTPSSRKPRVFKVEGALHRQDAELLESVCRQVSNETGRSVIIELNNVCFVDSDSAAVICRMRRENVVTIEGLNLFIKKVIELADESECGSEANCS